MNKLQWTRHSTQLTLKKMSSCPSSKITSTVFKTTPSGSKCSHHITFMVISSQLFFIILPYNYVPANNRNLDLSALEFCVSRITWSLWCPVSLLKITPARSMLCDYITVYYLFGYTQFCWQGCYGRSWICVHVQVHVQVSLNSCLEANSLGYIYTNSFQFR